MWEEEKKINVFDRQRKLGAVLMHVHALNVTVHEYIFFSTNA